MSQILASWLLVFARLYWRIGSLGVKLGDDQEKSWAPHKVCYVCVEGLRKWSHVGYGKKKTFRFGVPIARREQKFTLIAVIFQRWYQSERILRRRKLFHVQIFNQPCVQFLLLKGFLLLPPPESLQALCATISDSEYKELDNGEFESSRLQLSSKVNWNSKRVVSNQFRGSWHSWFHSERKEFSCSV